VQLQNKNGDVKSPLLASNPRRPVYCLPPTDFPPSSGSACLADSDEPSHVTKAMKPASTATRQVIRFPLDAVQREFFLMPLAFSADT